MEVPKELPLAFTLSFEMLVREVCGGINVVGRIPFVVIDAIQNAYQIIPPPSEKPLELVSKFLSLYLLGVLAADCRSSVAEIKAGLHRTGHSVKFQSVLIDVGTQTSVGQQTWAEKPLVGQVMDTEKS